MSPSSQAIESGHSIVDTATSRAPSYPAADIWQVLTRAKEHFGGRTAVRDGVQTLTYRELYGRATSLAAFWQQSGARAGSVVAVLMPNATTVIEAHFAAAGVRAIVLNLNVRLVASELAFLLKSSPPTWIVTTSDHAAVLNSAVDESGTRLKGVLWADELPSVALGAGIGESLRYEDVLRRATRTFSPLPGSEHDPYQLYYTSGTTGFPKGVLLTQRQIFRHALAAAEEMELSGVDTWGHFAPMYHVVDAFAIYAITWLGAQHYIASTPDPASFLSSISREGITATNLAAAAAHFLIHSPEAQSLDYSKLRILSCGGSALDRDTIRALIEILKCRMFMSYGMTECCGKISMSLLSDEQRASLSKEEQFELIATSGRPFKLMDVRIVGDDGIDVPKDGKAIGEVWIRGETVFAGYHGNPEATREAFEGGWFKTGDLASMRSDGYLTIADRKKDMLITYGENVYSQEVERVLYGHPDVLQAAVYGLPHAAAGEIVKAVLQLKPGARTTVQDVIAFCREKLAAYKVPQQVEFIETMPLSGTFKIDKHRLKQRDPDLARGPQDRALPSTARGAGHGLTREECEVRVRSIIQGVSVSDTSGASAGANLWQLGLDSILFIALTQELQRVFGVTLSPNFTTEHNTIEKIVEYLARHCVPEPTEVESVARPPLVGTQLPEGWAANVSRKAGAFESILYLANRAGMCHISTLVDIEGELDIERLSRACDLLHEEFPYLSTTMTETDQGEIRLQFVPGQRIELVFEHAGSRTIHEVVSEHLERAFSPKKILVVRSSDSPNVHTIVPLIWHCFMEAHGCVQLVFRLLELHEQLAHGAMPRLTPRELPPSREDLLAALFAKGGTPPTTLTDRVALKTAREATVDVLRMKGFWSRLPGEKRRPLTGKIKFGGGHRLSVLDAEQTRGVLARALAERSSLTAALSAALVLTAHEMIFAGKGSRQFVVWGSVDARPLLNLPEDALGYYAMYPRFTVDVAPRESLWDIARGLHREQQGYLAEQQYARIDPDFYERLVTMGKWLSRPPIAWTPLRWDYTVMLNRFFAINLGVVPDRVAQRFAVRQLRFLQDVPTWSVYSYVLDGRLHLFFPDPYTSRVESAGPDAFVNRLMRGAGIHPSGGSDALGVTARDKA